MFKLNLKLKNKIYFLENFKKCCFFNVQEFLFTKNFNVFQKIFQKFKKKKKKIDLTFFRTF